MHLNATDLFDIGGRPRLGSMDGDVETQPPCLFEACYMSRIHRTKLVTSDVHTDYAPIPILLSQLDYLLTVFYREVPQQCWSHDNHVIFNDTFEG